MGTIVALTSGAAIAGPEAHAIVCIHHEDNSLLVFDELHKYPKWTMKYGTCLKLSIDNLFSYFEVSIFHWSYLCFNPN